MWMIGSYYIHMLSWLPLVIIACIIHTTGYYTLLQSLFFFYEVTQLFSSCAHEVDTSPVHQEGNCAYLQVRKGFSEYIRQPRKYILCVCKHSAFDVLLGIE